MGETGVVSGAARAVGSLIGQMAKLKGARVVGIAGTKEKLTYLKEDLGFDAVVNYKSDRFYDELKSATPNGVDNVGGAVSDRVLSRIIKGPHPFVWLTCAL